MCSSNLCTLVCLLFSCSFVDIVSWWQSNGNILLWANWSFRSTSSVIVLAGDICKGHRSEFLLRWPYFDISETYEYEILNLVFTSVNYDTYSFSMSDTQFAIVTDVSFITTYVIVYSNLLLFLLIGDVKSWLSIKN